MLISTNHSVFLFQTHSLLRAKLYHQCASFFTNMYHEVSGVVLCSAGVQVCLFGLCGILSIASVGGDW